MNIRIYQGIEGAKQAQGVSVVIDVFRAFSLECFLFAVGAQRVLPVGAVETAQRLRQENADFLLIGERHGRILPGFDFGNSPSQIRAEAVAGRTIVHTTSAGTQGIVAASRGAEEVLTGSLVNAKAIARYIQRRAPREVSIICMGKEGREESPEDTLCGRYLKAMLEGTSIDLAKGLEEVRCHREGRKFFDIAQQEVFPRRDFEMCTMVDRFDMVLRVVRRSDDVFESIPITDWEKES